MRSVRSIFFTSLAAAAVSAALAGNAVADHEGGWEEILPAQIIVNLAQETNAQITWARQAIDRGTLVQEIGFVDSSGAEGYLLGVGLVWQT